MTQHDAFLRAIATPEDDAPRLVYPAGDVRPGRPLRRRGAGRRYQGHIMTYGRSLSTAIRRPVVGRAASLSSGPRGQARLPVLRGRAVRTPSRPPRASVGGPTRGRGRLPVTPVC